MKIATLLLLTLLTACSPSPQKLAARCAAVKVRKPKNECTQSGNGIACSSDFLQPHNWGRCLETEDRNAIVCEKDQKVWHYPNQSPVPDWVAPDNVCANVAALIAKSGQDPEQHITVPIAVEPKGPRT